MQDNMYVGNETMMVRRDGEKLMGVYPNQNQVIGYTAKAYNELEADYNSALEVLDGYKDILIKNGLLEEEKTAEQQLADINGKFDKMLDMFGSFNERIEGFEKRLDRVEERNGHTENPTGSKQANRSKPEPT